MPWHNSWGGNKRHKHSISLRNCYRISILLDKWNEIYNFVGTDLFETGKIVWPCWLNLQNWLHIVKIAYVIISLRVFSIWAVVWPFKNATLQRQPTPQWYPWYWHWEWPLTMQFPPSLLCRYSGGCLKACTWDRKSEWQARYLRWRWARSFRLHKRVSTFAVEDAATSSQLILQLHRLVELLEVGLSACGCDHLHASRSTFRFLEVMLKMWMLMLSRGFCWLLLLLPLLNYRLYSLNFSRVS